MADADEIIPRIWLGNRRAAANMEWLQMNTLKFLEVIEETDKLIVTPLGKYTDDDKYNDDSRAVTTFDDIEHCIYEFLRYTFI